MDQVPKGVLRRDWRPRLWLAAALVAGCTLHLAGAGRSDGTAAGTSISNTATATYADPNNPGETLNTTSNTVTITVAEVAGITVTPLAITDMTSGTGVMPGDQVLFDFLVTSVGNDPTRLFIPDAASVTGPATAGTLQISTNGGTSYTDIPAGGVTTASVAAAGSVRVRVPVTLTLAAPSGAPIIVVLGNTGGNDNSAGTQNQAYPTAPAGNDVRTVDNADGTSGETAGPPANGEREASGRQEVLVGAQAQAFAAILKTRTGYTDSGTGALTDDVVTYGLSLRVDAVAPASVSSSLIPADLVATSITLGGSSVPRVLISDAIPAGTVLQAAATAPAGWTAVYTTTPTTTAAHLAAWSATLPGSLSAVTRVGFVHLGPISKGSLATGFLFQVVTSGVSPSTSTTIANIAQLFGQSSGDSTNALVYDESGDQNGSNFQDTGQAGSNTPTSGVANPSVDGIDAGNNNTGLGAGGEDNTFTLAPPGTILNGPNGLPGAVGPTDNNDDFTNQSTPIPANTVPSSTIDPAPVTFTNTIQNPGTAAVSNLLLVPTAPSTSTALPANTTVTLTYGANTAVYTYNGTLFIFTSGTSIQIPSLGPGASVNYTAVVNLPAGTALSTDTGAGYPAPIRAFADSDLDAVLDAGESYNVTIDRVYTGFLKLVKEARVLDTDGTTVVQDFTSAPATVNIRPGRYIEYRITYTNISTVPSGSGNGLLNAVDVVITEDGTALPNNWATDMDGNGSLDTSNVVGSAADSGPATITYFSGATGTTSSPDQSGTTAATDVTKYINTVTNAVIPGESRTFTFRRRIN
jgi:hypothetical protein